MTPSVCAIVVAGGTGTRSGRAMGKQLATVAGRPVVAWSLMALDRCGLAHIVVVCPAEKFEQYEAEAIAPSELSTPVTLAASGATRYDSVLSGLAAVPGDTQVVVIHDGARPLVEPQTVRGAIELLEDVADADGVVVGHPSVDTLKRVEGGRIVETVDRSVVWSAQTPQVFRIESLRRSHAGDAGGAGATDDSALVERAGGTVLMFEGPRDNIKVTLPEDFAFVEAVLRQRLEKE